MCQFDEPVLFCVVSGFIWDSLKEEQDWEKGFLLSRQKTEVDVFMPEAVLGRQEKSAEERPAVMFHFSLPYAYTCFICELRVLLSLVFNTPKYLTQEVSPTTVGLRQNKQAC